MLLSKRTLVVAVLVASQGCYIDFKRPGGPKVMTGSRGNPWTKQATRYGDNPPLGGGFASKVVEDKKPPTRLIARDRTSCVVSDKKYQSTVVGESVWCTWFDTDR